MEFKLILKKINNELTEKEQILFDEWYAESEIHRQYYKNVIKNYGKSLDGIDVEVAYKNLVPKLRRKKALFTPLRVAAIAAAITVLISLPFISKQDDPELSVPVVATEKKIEIGTDKAVLTLEDGSEIPLEAGKSYTNKHLTSNGKELTYDTSDNKTSEIKYNTLTIPRGGQFFITLSDGTQVWLNSESKIKYPVTFTKGNTRMVELIYGEAYFDVSPSTQHQGADFMVKSQEQNVKVLGTEFNVKAYKSDSYIATTLVEGSVSIENNGSTRKLTPGNQSNFNTVTNTIKITAVDVNDAISWKEGLFSFKNKTLHEIMLQLSRWYDVDIEIENAEAGEIRFNGVFNKHQDLENILLTIENTNEAKFEKIENKIIMK